MSALDSTPVSSAPSRSRAFLAQLRTGDPARAAVIERAERTADVLAAATADEEMIASALLVPLLDAGYVDDEFASAQVGPEAARMAREQVRLDGLTAPRPWVAGTALSSQQA